MRQIELAVSHASCPYKCAAVITLHATKTKHVVGCSSDENFEFCRTNQQSENTATPQTNETGTTKQFILLYYEADILLYAA